MKPITFLSLVFSLCVCPAKGQKKAPCAEKNGPYTHIVKKGETLNDIGKLYNIDVEDLIAWNKLSNARIVVHPCQKILLVPAYIYKERLSKSDTLLPAPGILSLSISNKYKVKIRSIVEKLWKAVNDENPAEIGFYFSTEGLWNADWFSPETHFYNTESDLQKVIARLTKLDSLITHPIASRRDLENLQTLLNECREHSKIEPVYANGFRICSLCDSFFSWGPIIEEWFKGWNIVDTDNQPVPFNSVYLMPPRIFSFCSCVRCFLDNFHFCDISELQGHLILSEANKDGKYDFHYGPFHVIVTQKSGNIEKIIHYEKRKFTKADEGKTITLKVSGN